jgi:hypothetical protein
MKTTAVRFTSGWSRTLRTARQADQRASAKQSNGGEFTFQAFAVLLALCAATHSAHGEVLWYGGDLSGIGFINNTHTTPEYGSSVLDDFVVSSPSGWRVTGLFSNNIADPTNLPVASAVWSVRTDVTSGNAGVIVAAGVSPATIAFTGRTVSGSGGIAWTEYSVSVDVSLDLDPGTYYMNVSPIASLQVYYGVERRKRHGPAWPGQRRAGGSLSSRRGLKSCCGVPEFACVLGRSRITAGPG